MSNMQRKYLKQYLFCVVMKCVCFRCLGRRKVTMSFTKWPHQTKWKNSTAKLPAFTCLHLFKCHLWCSLQVQFILLTFVPLLLSTYLWFPITPLDGGAELRMATAPRQRSRWLLALLALRNIFLFKKGVHKNAVLFRGESAKGCMGNFCIHLMYFFPPKNECEINES